MVTMNVSLPDPMKSWVEQQSQSGRYANSSDYVRDLIRRDQHRAEAISQMQSQIEAGLTSGPAKGFDAAAFKQRMRGAQGG